jgi:hypothetical protein
MEIVEINSEIEDLNSKFRKKKRRYTLKNMCKMIDY